MKVTPTALKEILLIEPDVFGDERGFFFESYNERTWRETVGFAPRFVQANHSASGRHVLRGLHYQIRQPQGKLVRAISGEIFDVAVDLRPNSPSFGKWVGATLSAANKLQIWIPEGFAHGFLVLSEMAEVLYMATDFYAPQHERSIRWDDSSLAIRWPLAGDPILSGKDMAAKSFKDADYFD
jgi:dTDP-4-dehydrorhamnose 3,5-epimerase